MGRKVPYSAGMMKALRSGGFKQGNRGKFGYDIIKENAPCDVKPRSLRLNSSSIDENHEIVKAGIEMGRETYGSPTLSDQAALSCQSLKLGPGDSTRSHSADEFIYVHEIEEGIELYIELLSKILK